MSDDQNKNLARRFFDDLCNGRNQAAADELFGSHHRYHDLSSPWVGTGPAGMKQLISTYYTAFPDAHWNMDEMLVAGNTVVTRWTATGTQRNDLLGIPPTGKSVKVQGIWIHRINGGRIEESWNAWDALGMMQQLGIVPVMSGSVAAS